MLVIKNDLGVLSNNEFQYFEPKIQLELPNNLDSSWQINCFQRFTCYGKNAKERKLATALIYRKCPFEPFQHCLPVKKRRFFLWCIVIGDEKWIFYDNPNRYNNPKSWVNSGESSRSTPKRCSVLRAVKTKWNLNWTNGTTYCCKKLFNKRSYPLIWLLAATNSNGKFCLIQRTHQTWYHFKMLNRCQKGMMIGSLSKQHRFFRHSMAMSPKKWEKL